MRFVLVSVLVYVLNEILIGVGVTALSPFRYVDEDPLITFEIENFKPDDVKKLPIKFRFIVAIRNGDSFRQYYSDTAYCVEIDGGDWRECKPLLGYDISCDELEEGSHSVVMYVTDREGGDRYHETKPVNFSVVADESFDMHCEERVKQRREEFQFPKDEGILQWAERQRKHVAPSTIADGEDGDIFVPSNNSDVFIAIGIKTAVLTNFPKRQAIRDTWASRASLPPHVKVLFLGCMPNVSAIPSARDRRRIESAVDLERATYGDLLTEELECEDGYQTLADKVKAYFHFAVAEFSGAGFVVLADDDIYLRVDYLSDYLRERNPQRQYLGEVWRELLNVKEHPLRDPNIPNYLPMEQYPMPEYPPYAIGACYVVSMDSARFIAKNSWRLRSLNGIEDATTALWLLTRQVHYKLAPFSSLRIAPCVNTAISMGEFSTLGIRLMHANLQNNRELCHGFDRTLWQWSAARSVSSMLALPEKNPTLRPTELQVELFVQSEAELSVIVSTPLRAGTKWPYFTALESVAVFSSRTCNQIQQANGDMNGLSKCTEIIRASYERLQLTDN